MLTELSRLPWGKGQQGQLAKRRSTVLSLSRAPPRNDSFQLPGPEWSCTEEDEEGDIWLDWDSLVRQLSTVHSWDKEHLEGVLRTAK
eukprot:7498790-Lingulodinium_polyedra.AAC.1